MAATPRYGTAEMAPVWLAPEDVKAWLRLNAQDADDDDLIEAACAMTEPYVQRCRPEWANYPGGIGPAYGQGDYGFGSYGGSADIGYDPDPETYQGAVMYAAREYRRRNSPAGIEAFGEVMSFVVRYDTDIERALQTGSYARPIVS